jgi:hypothetical protein
MVAVVVGLGAVILSRAGRDRHYAGGGWSPDDDPFGPEPDPFGPRPDPFDPPPSSSEMRWETEGGAPEARGADAPDREDPHGS